MAVDSFLTNIIHVATFFCFLWQGIICSTYKQKLDLTFDLKTLKLISFLSRVGLLAVARIVQAWYRQGYVTGTLCSGGNKSFAGLSPDHKHSRRS